MTFEEYINNPMGKSNVVMSATVRETQRKIYTSKFDNLLLRENGKIEYFLYKSKNAYYAHIKVPSEVVKDFYYDVVIKFTSSKTLMESASGLDKYQVHFYSNDPAFVYNYAYTFNKRDLFLSELSPKMSKTALRQPAKEKNPENQVGYVKSIFFAYLFMKRRGLFSKIKYNSAPEFSLRAVLPNIEHADTKIEKRQEEGAKVSKRKKTQVSQDTLKKITRGSKDLDLSNVAVTTTKKVKVAKNAATNVKRTKSTKKV